MDDTDRCLSYTAKVLRNFNWLWVTEKAAAAVSYLFLQPIGMALGQSANRILIGCDGGGSILFEGTRQQN